jgi:NADPH-dependent curcumin reductase CurA
MGTPMHPPINRQWLLARRPHGLVSPDDFRWAETSIPTLEDGEVLVRNLYLSCDPTQRSWMAGRTYMPAISLGEVIRSFAVGEVRASRSAAFEEGRIVYGMFGWQDYCAARAGGFFPMMRVAAGMSLEAALGVFGLTGLTAYFGLLHVGGLESGKTVVVSGAAGATGSVAGQIAKALGCHVVGIAGGREKCGYLTGVLGFDAAIDYKAENVMRRLRDTCPNGIDLFFDNVGGRILDVALLHLARHARVVICGSISGYGSDTPPEGPRNYMQLLVTSSRMQGFVMTDFNDHVREATAALRRWVDDGRIKTRSDVVDGMDKAPAALARLFAGENRGKQLVRIAAPTSGVSDAGVVL